MIQNRPTMRIYYESRKGNTPYDGIVESFLSAESGRETKIVRVGRWLLPSERNKLEYIRITLDEMGVPYSFEDVGVMGFSHKIKAKLKSVPRLEVNGKSMSFSFSESLLSEDIEEFYKSSTE